MEAKPSVGSFYGLENLGVAIAERVCRPTILEVDVAIAVEIPDEVTLRPVDDDLPYRTKAALPGPLHFCIKPQAISEKRNAALKCRARLRAWEIVVHNVNPRRYCSISCFVRYLALRVWPANYLP
jgi:hypothetical protein